MSSASDTDDSFLDGLAARAVIESDGHVTSVSPPPTVCRLFSREPSDGYVAFILIQKGENRTVTIPGAENLSLEEMNAVYERARYLGSLSFVIPQELRVKHPKVQQR